MGIFIFIIGKSREKKAWLRFVLTLEILD